MFDQDVNEEVIYQNDWSEFPDSEGNSPVLSRLFDNLFGWIDPVNGAGFFKNQNQLSAQLLAEDPSLNIQALEDGFELEARKLDAIRQRSSRGFTIIDINPGLLSEREYPLNIPYEFIYDGTNFIPDQDDSLIKNFRSVPIDIAGDFVKIEFIYENNTRANYSDTNRRPGAQIKYQGALKNTYTVNGQTIYNEQSLTTGYEEYYFDNYSRRKVYLGFGDNSQKPHIITKSGDYFKTYFSSLVLSLNVGSPKVRITIGFNSEKYDGPNDSAINSNLETIGMASLLRESDTVLNSFCISESDTQNSPVPFGLTLFSAAGVPTNTIIGLLVNNGFNVSGGPISLGYSVLWITGMQFTLNKNSAAASFAYLRATLVLTPDLLLTDNERVHGFKIDLFNNAQYESKEYIYSPSKPIRVVIPSGWNLALILNYESSSNTSWLLSYNINGYAFGDIRKFFNGIAFVNSTTKYLTDSTMLSEFNKVNVPRGF